MKRKLLSVMLSIAMAVTMISITTTNIYAQDFTGWTVLTDGGTLNAGNYYLQSDVTLTNNITFSGGDVTLDLNGYVLKGNGNGSVITVNGGNLTIQDSNPNNTHTEVFASLPAGGCITGGKGTQVSSEFLGGGVYVAAGGTLVMNGGTIYNCEATKGGGVFTWGNFTMNNSSAIVNCTATVDGGGVCACDCSFIMNNNSIVSNCKANRGAGGVYIFGNPDVFSSFTMNDNSTINECEANTKSSERCGGGVCVEGNKCSFIMNSGFITNNSAKNGGGVNVFSGTFTMNSGSINNNTVTSHGGAIAVGNGAIANIVDGTIENNKATESGGAVQVDGNFTMTGGTIKNNSAIKDGGGLSVNGTIGIATLAGTTEIINNTASIKGGGVSYYGNNFGKVVLGGKVKIIGNVENGTIAGGTLTGGTTNNVYLYSNNLYITIGTGIYAPTDGMLVGITTYTSPAGTPVQFTTNGTANDVEYFASDNASYKVQYNTSGYLELANITIADVLATVPGGFPTTSSSGWVSQSGVKMYIDGNNLQSGTDNTMTLSDVLTPVGDNYSITPTPFWTFTFVMQSGVLSRIDLQTPESLLSYYPYAYTNPSISKPVGYTGDIEFVTNGKYVDQSTTPVTVSVDDIVLDYDIDYEVTTGSTHVKLKGSFVSTLPVGTHTLKTSMNGYDDITTQFTITAAPSPTPDSNPTPRYKIPNTGVEGMPTNNHSLLKLSTLSIFSIGTYLVTKKKKDND